MIYAGIGSRETPQHVLQRFTLWSYYFSNTAHIKLRSGRAKGADTAFEIGCLHPSMMELFVAENARNRPDWHNLAAQIHPAWDRCSDYERLLHARNGPIILGDNLETPVDFCCCWTKDGKASGGTGQALRICQLYNIPVFNWFYADAEDKLRSFLIQRGCPA